MKHGGDDFTANASLGYRAQQGTTADFAYHQAVTRALTAGGSVSAQLGGLAPVLPEVRALSWGVFGSWRDARRGTVALARYDGSAGRLDARVWRQAHKHLALGTGITTSIGGEWDSSASAGMRYTLGSEAGSASTLTASVSTDLKSAVSWSKTNSPIVRVASIYCSAVSCGECGVRKRPVQAST